MSTSDIRAHQVERAAASDTLYDAVVVGAGVSGSIIASELSRQGLHVLVVEAGPGDGFTIDGYEAYLAHFYASVMKDNNSPYPDNANAPMPRSQDVRALRVGETDASNYLVQNGPFAVDSTFTRVVGGTTMHWEGKTLRLLPEDFELQTRYDQGLDWPISYEELMPYYRRAEFEIGVSGDVEDQAYLGITFEPDYVYPMRKMPLTYLDQAIAKRIDGTTVTVDREEYALTVRSTPQGRNGVPNAAYDGGRGYRPVGAVSDHQADEGERCQGNINCVPICPVQAKYNARKTLLKALATGRVDVLAKAVASRIHVDPESGRVTHVEYKAYEDLTSSEHTTGTVRGRIFVLAAHAVENARLMLASGLNGSSDLVGRNLMDHAYLLTWALMPEVTGTMRGTVCTAGIEELRGGPFRRHQAAFRMSIHNDGWGWATGAPYTDLIELVDNENRYGLDLRRQLVDRISRQLLLDFMVEVLPEHNNRVTVDPRFKDQLGNLRPIVSFNLSDYTLAGLATGRRVSRQIYQRLGAQDHTWYDPTDYSYVGYQGAGYTVRGGNHQAGTHVMGTNASNSVVDSHQRSWDHENLYLVGAGSMPTIGTANTTLTLSALSFITADHIVAELTRDAAPVAVATA